MQQKITFSEICAEVALATSLPRKDTEDFLRELFNVVAKTLSEGETVRIKGIGTFKVSRIGQRRSVDVTTGNDILLPEHTRVQFIPAKALASAANGPFEDFEAVELAPGITEELLNARDDDRDGDVTDNPDIAGKETPPNPSKESSSTPGAVSASEADAGAMQTPGTENSAPAPGHPEVPAEETEGENPTYVSGGGQEESLPTVPASAPLAPFIASPAKTVRKATAQAVPSARPEEVKPEAPAPPHSGSPTEPATLAEETMPHPSADTSPGEPDSVDDGHYAESVPSLDNPAEEWRDSNDDGAPVGRKVQRHGPLRFWPAVAVAFAILCGVLILLILINPQSRLNPLSATFSNKFENLREAMDREQADENAIHHPASPPAAEPASTAPAVPSAESPAPQTRPRKQDSPSPEAPTTPSDAPAQPVYDRVSTTRYLTTIAREKYGNQHFWPYIYLENEAVLGHPNRITPGTRVVVPPLSKYHVDPGNPDDVRKAKNLGAQIYARYEKPAKKSAPSSRSRH